MSVIPTMSVLLPLVHVGRITLDEADYLGSLLECQPVMNWTPSYWDDWITRMLEKRNQTKEQP